jgi:enoyl-[acyl-carrier protein] reductase II
MNEVTDMLGSEYPIIQGAMAGCSNPEMVAAVSDAGGYGLLASGSMAGKGQLIEQMEAVHKLTKKPFGVNLMAMNPKSPDYVDIIADFGITTVTTSAGSPAKLIPLLHDRGIKVIQVVPTAALAMKVEAMGVDAVVAEGTESGGMQGANGVATMVLVPAVVDSVKIPVLAAGGIVDSRGYNASFALGAQGVQIGTAFMVSKECIIEEEVKNLMIEAAETDTTLLGSGRAFSRTLVTPEIRALLEKAAKESASPGHGGSRAALREEGLSTTTAGQCVGLLRGIRSVKEIIEEMVS